MTHRRQELARRRAAATLAEKLAASCSPCVVCGQDFTVDTLITKVSEGQYRHSACEAKACRHCGSTGEHADGCENLIDTELAPVEGGRT